MYVCIHYLCMYVCMHVCMYVCRPMYICGPMYVCTYVGLCMYVRMYVCMYVCMYACMNVCVYALGMHVSVRFAGGSGALDPLASFFAPLLLASGRSPGGRLDPLKFITCNPLHQTTQ